jgi:multidrug efflux pump subunit AcrA (membrane-fusion protein)
LRSSSASGTPKIWRGRGQDHEQAAQAVALLAIAAVSACRIEPPQPEPAAVQVVRIAQAGAAAPSGDVRAIRAVAMRRETSLGFTSPGRIGRIVVEEGQEARSGQLLATLDTTMVAADLARAGRTLGG